MSRASSFQFTERPATRYVPRWAVGLLFVVAWPVCAGAFDAGAFDGASLFAEKCSECHGEAGQGTNYYGLTLAGDLPVRELTRIITETMPEGDPEACVGAEAKAIARHAYEAFYSPLAQARIRPPRRELSRLTVRQYQQSLADLFAEFRSRRDQDSERGLRARFYARVNTGKIGEPAEFVVPNLDLRLSEMADLPEAIRDPDARGPEQFGNDKINVVASFRGGLLAPATGQYEFVVRTANSVELSINQTMVIDAKIRSDDSDEVRGTTWLVGGRVYPIDLATSRTRETDLDIELHWRPPRGIHEVIPSRALSPLRHPAVHATEARFPADDRSVGYVRGANISVDWDEATTTAALGAVEAILDDLPEFTKRPGEEARVSIEELTAEAAVAFCERFAATAFRHPLSEQERETFVARYFEEGNDPSPLVDSVSLSVLSVLKSPRFLYPEVGHLDSQEPRRAAYTVATRLALGLWDSLPDAKLLSLAEHGRLTDRGVATREADRMLRDPRTKSKLAEFFEHWLRLDHAAQLSRDPEEFPDFNDRVAADMRVSLECLLNDVVWHGDGDLRELFLTEDLFVNQRLARFLGLDPPEDGAEEFVKASVDTSERAGVVSHPFIVTAFSYYRETSPIHRGVFLARNVLGRSLRPPPEAVAPLAPELAPDMTTRERVAAQTSPGACQACHVLINDLGFTLERFDAVGRYRDTELDRPIDATGGYIATDGGTVRLGGARDLARFLADSEDVHRSFVTQLFEHVTKQPILAYGIETREQLLNEFRQDGFNIRNLLASIAVTAALAD